MTKIIIACALALLSVETAAASEKTAVMSVIHQWVDAFNKGDMKSSLAACADQAVVLDEIPPHVWQGSGACAAWGDAYVAWAKSNGVTAPFESIGKLHQIDISGEFAYVVQSTSFSWTEKGRSMSEKGRSMSEKALETVTLKKTSAGWRITGWAWADL
jgi:ketosteroid isomerase-like protein